MAARIGSRVTPTAKLLLPATIGPDTARRAEWLAARQGDSVGSSDVAAILGVEETRPAREVWLAKRGRLPDYDNEYMYWGRRLEDLVAQEWAMRNQSVVERIGVVANVDRPWMRTTLDRRVVECPLNRDRKTACALEIKCRSAFRPTKFHHGEMPDDLLAQTTWQRLVTGYDHVHVGALVGGNRFTQTVARRDDDFDAWVLDEVTTWRQRHLVEGVEPPPEPEKAAKLIELDKLLHPDRVGDVELSPVEVGEVFEYVSRAAIRGRADKAVKAQKAALLRLTEGKARALLGGRLVFEWAPRERVKVDVDALAERWPEVYDQVVSRTSYFQLSITPEFRAGLPDEVTHEES